MNVWIGIDPGMTGAMVVRPENDDTPTIFDYEDGDTASFYLDRILKHHDVVCAALEQIEIYPGRNGSHKTATAMSAIVRNAGRWEGLLIAHNIPFVEVAPKRWQRWSFLGLGMGRQTTKKQSLAAARHRYPELAEKGAGLGLEKHHNRADAVNIAEWCFEFFKKDMDIDLYKRAFTRRDS